MSKVELSKRHLELLEKSVRYTICDLQYERHQARMHRCSPGTYDEEIAEYKQLKEYILNANI